MNQLAPSRGGFSLAPRTLDEAMRFADLISNTDMVPKDYRGKPANILVAIQQGSELGLAPMQALQSISVVNGRPTVWGDAAMALVQAHPACEYVKEWIEGEGDKTAAICEVKRRGHPAHRVRFDVTKARKAGLWNKPGPWQQYPERMLQLRARGFALRDKFADALRGVITTEEARDYPAEATIDAPAEFAPAGHALGDAISETRRELLESGQAYAAYGITILNRNKYFETKEEAWEAIREAAENAQTLEKLELIASANAEFLEPVPGEEIHPALDAARTQIAATRAMFTRNAEPPAPEWEAWTPEQVDDWRERTKAALKAAATVAEVDAIMAHDIMEYVRNKVPKWHTEFRVLAQTVRDNLQPAGAAE